MPILADQDGMDQNAGVGGFQFSATKIGNLGATEYTLVALVVDKSGSLRGFDAEIEACVRSVIESCQRSPRADNLMARVLVFATHADELHGYKPLADCHLGIYAGKIHTGGSTCLYDASVDAIDSMAAYGKTLLAQDYATNGIVIIMTDGRDECSTLTAKAVKEALGRAMSLESLESLVTILIGFNVQDPTVGAYLERFKDEVGFTQYVEAKDASPQTLAKIAGFISKSVSSQSQSLGTKAPSQPLGITF